MCVSVVNETGETHLYAAPATHRTSVRLPWNARCGKLIQSAQQLPRAAVPASARLRRDVDTAEPAQRSSFAAARAAEVRAFTPVVPPRGRAAPSVLRLRGDERRVAVTRGFLRRRVAAKWGFLRRRCRLRRRGRPQPRWQETTVSRRRFERRAYRASVPPEVAAPAGPAVPAAARYQRQHFSERGYKFFFFFFTFYSNLYAHPSSRKNTPWRALRRSPALS